MPNEVFNYQHFEKHSTATQQNAKIQDPNCKRSRGSASQVIKIWSYKDHGKSFDAVYHRVHRPGFHWLHESFGTNWRMTEMQAAIGRVQLRKLPQWLTLRRRNAAVLTDGFSRIPGLRLTIPPQEIEHAYYKYSAMSG